MSKTIKVDDEVYKRLEALIVHRETFSHVIVRLLKVYDMIYEVSEILGPSHYLKEFQHGPEKIRDQQVR